MIRKNPLVTGDCYHIISRSISNFIIFNQDDDYIRMLNLIRYYQYRNLPIRYSIFMRTPLTQQVGFHKSFNSVIKDQDKIIEIIAYCLMPTHIHLILKQLKDGGISIYMRKFLDGYSKFFNLTHHRHGPLWESRFKNILIKTDEQLLHLTRYIHLNPSTASLVKKPEQWHYSSYTEYLDKIAYPITNFDDLLDIVPKDYKRFVEDRITYQKELAKIKSLILE